MPSEVFGLASYSASGAWMKKPLLLRAVTMPWVVTEPDSGEVEPGTLDVVDRGEVVVRDRADALAVGDRPRPLTLVASTKNVSFGSNAVSPFTDTSNVAVVLPDGDRLPVDG